MIDKLIAIFFRLRDKIMNSHFVSRFEQRFPVVEHFLLERFSILHFRGLPLTALAVALVLNIALLSELTEKVMNSGSITRIDSIIAHYFFSVRSDFIAEALYLFTQIGNEITIVSMTILLTLYFIRKRLYTYLISLLVAVLGSGMTIFTGKKIFKINRPDEFAYYAENSFSFPSGHSTIAVAFYGFLVYLLLRYQKKSSTRNLTFYSGLFLVLTIGFSRIYLCVHYLSDVLGGYLLGLSWLILAITNVEWNLRKRRAG